MRIWNDRCSASTAISKRSALSFPFAPSLRTRGYQVGTGLCTLANPRRWRLPLLGLHQGRPGLKAHSGVLTLHRIRQRTSVAVTTASSRACRFLRIPWSRHSEGTFGQKRPPTRLYNAPPMGRWASSTPPNCISEPLLRAWARIVWCNADSCDRPMRCKAGRGRFFNYPRKNFGAVNTHELKTALPRVPHRVDRSVRVESH